MNSLDQVKSELRDCADPEKARVLPRFFQAFPGGYGEGDQFIGVSVPDQRRIAKRHFRSVTLEETGRLLRESIHEYRLTALFIMIEKFDRATSDADRDAIIALYMDNLGSVNNWDLVDASAYKLLGAHLHGKDKALLYELASSGDLWKQRVAMISTFHFIKMGEFEDTLEISGILLEHQHDLIHKAVGWMLREVGKRNFQVEFKFLKAHYRKMPRTMLRYAIEKFPPDQREAFLKGRL